MRTLLLAVAASLIAAPTSAQQWTAEQRGVIDHVQACWEAWGEEDMSMWDGACLSDPGVRFWWMDESVPSYGPEGDKRWAEAFFPRIEASIHFEHRPIGVQLFSDVAVYQYWATWTQADPNGQVVTQAQHRLDILQRRDGRWVFIGGAGAQQPGT